MRFPEGHDGDVALAVAATRVIASPAYPVDEWEVRRMAERDQASGVRETAAHRRGDPRGRLVIVPGVGHYLPAAVYPRVADEVRALADRAATAAPKPG